MTVLRPLQPHGSEFEIVAKSDLLLTKKSAAIQNLTVLRPLQPHSSEFGIVAKKRSALDKLLLDQYDSNTYTLTKLNKKADAINTCLPFIQSSYLG